MNTKKLIHLFFKNRTGVLATMHQKEKVIAPVLEKSLGIKIIVPENLNTDLFGTFTREINRKGDQLDAARYKANESMLLTKATLAIASEGSFGPHPASPFLPFNREIVLLIDKENNMEIVGVSGSTDTNFNEKTIKSFDEAYQFALTAGFPEHGIVIRSGDLCNKPQKILKGITTKEGLRKAFECAIAWGNGREVIIETDMRAMFNPTRMKVIEQATKDLVSKIYNLCPVCSYPGFEVVERKKGLRCGWCGLPTELTFSDIYTCKKCGISRERLFPSGREKADPGQCSYCNP